MKNGIFVSFEGGEGCGKTTQINKIAHILAEEGHNVITTREPGGTPEGESLRDLLVQRGSARWTPLAETLLVLAARALHIDHVIRPALEKGKIVLCDRFSDSTRAYQGYGRGLAIETIESLSQTALKNFEPHATYILDLPVEEGLSRSSRRLAAETFSHRQPEDRFEKMDRAFHERVRTGFLEIARNHPKRCVLLDASKPAEGITQAILQDLRKRIGT